MNRVNRDNKSRELVETLVDQEIGEIDNSRSQGVGDQVIVEKLVTMFPNAGQSKGRRTVDDSSKNSGQLDSNHSSDGNEINVANSRSGEVQSLEDSMIGEVL